MENKHINKVNQYMRLSEKIINPHSILEPSTNLGSLAKILKKRNQKFGEKKITNPELNSLHEKLVKQTWATQIVKGEDQKKQSMKEVQKPFQHAFFTLQNQEEYLQKHLEYGAHKEMSKKMRERGGKEKGMKEYIISRLKGYNYDHIDSGQKSAPKIKQSKRKQLQQLVKESVEKGNFNLMFQKLSYSNNHEIWNILHEQIKEYEYLQREDAEYPKLGIFKTSLRFLQEKFNSQLPTSSERISQYLKRNYVEKNKQYIVDRNGLYQWGIAYAYLRSGKKYQFQRKLSELGRPGINLREVFMQLDESMKQNNPELISFMDEGLKDTFYTQLVHILKRQPAISSPKLMKKNSSDLIWLMLQTLGVYSCVSEKVVESYWQLCDQILTYYLSEQFKNYEDYYHMVYLGKYSSIIDLQENRKFSEKLDSEEYVHLLIALNSKPQILDDPLKFQLKLKEQLVQYIKQLMKKASKYTLYYMLLIPEEHIVESFQELFPSFQTFQKFDSLGQQGQKGWDFLSHMFNDLALKQQFQQAFTRVIFRLAEEVTEPEDISWLALRIKKILPGSETLPGKVLLFGLCQCEVRRMNRGSADDSIIYNQLMKQIKSTRVPDSFKMTVDFIQMYKKLQLLLKEKKIHEIREFIASQTYTKDLILLASESKNEFKSFINCLESYKGSRLFLNYIKKYLSGVELVSHRSANFTEIKQTRAMLLHSLKQLEKKKSRFFFEELEELKTQLENYC